YENCGISRREFPSVDICRYPRLLEVIMTSKLALGVISLFLITGLAMPQQTTKTTHKKTRTLTGCLAKEDGGGGYQLTTKTGSTWELKSDSVKLDEHVGHMVRVKGVVSNAKLHGMKEDAKGEM